eukprot:3853894-Pyramimonas_sp.AAC.1
MAEFTATRTLSRSSRSDPSATNAGRGSASPSRQSRTWCPRTCAAAPALPTRASPPAARAPP